MNGTLRTPSVLPGFGLTLGFSTFFLSAIVLIPLAALVIKTATMGWDDLVRVLLEPRAVASYRLSFGAALLAATLNSVFGFIIAWTLTRYEFPGRKLIDALIDMPFALPTAVSGIALTAVFAENGWIGQYLAPFGIKVAYTWIGIVVALTLIGLPFVVRSVQPALMEVQRDLEDAAETLGAGRFTVFRRIILPTVLPALATGFTHGVRARGRRVRLGDLHRRQPADEDRDHAAADRHQARAVRLRRRRGARLHDAGAVVRHAAVDQPAADLGAATSSRRGTLMAGPGTSQELLAEIASRPGRDTVLSFVVKAAFITIVAAVPGGAAVRAADHGVRHGAVERASSCTSTASATPTRWPRSA